MRRRYMRGMSTLEYTMILVIAAAALIGIEIYVKRAICGRWRQAADTFGFGRQYNTSSLKIWGR